MSRKPTNRKPAPAGQRQAKYCKDAKAIAAAWGVSVYAGKRGMLTAQLAPIAEICRRADFPKKTPHGWPYREVFDWGIRHLELSGKNRKFKLKSVGEPPPALGELPAAAAPAGDDDLFIQLTPEEKLDRRLDLLEEKYLNPELHPESKISQWEVKELRQHRPHIWSADAGAGHNGESVPADCNSITEVARVISAHFKVDCRKQYVSDWRQGKRLPTGVPLFPPPDPKSNRYVAGEFLPWYERHILKRVNGSAATRDLFQTLSEERDRAELEEIGHQRWLREKEKGGWLPKETVDRTFTAVGLTARNTTRELFEKSARIAALAAVESVLPTLAAADKATLDEALRAAGVKQFDEWQAEFGRRLEELAASVAEKNEV